MRYSSGLLWGLSRALEASEISPNDGDTLVPPLLSPVLEIPVAHRTAGAFDVTLAQLASFDTSSQATQAAAAAEATVTVCTFGQGLWRVQILYAFVSSFTQAFDALANNFIRMQDPAGNQDELARGFRVTNVPQLYRGRYLWLFTDSGWSLRMTNGATAAGQTQQSWAAVGAVLLT